MIEDKRLIEDYLPTGAISEESRIENSVTQARGYLSKALLSILHRWWARRPLAACRAAVYGALVPASRFIPGNGTDAQKKSLGRANATKFVKALSQRSVSRDLLEQAADHIREAHEGKAPRVLDMFAGGGSIPLEAARLGCESYALELNPVAHLVELATLVYPAQFGQKLVEEVRRWSQVVYETARKEVGDLYPPIPDPQAKPAKLGLKRQARFDATGFEPRQPELETPGGYLTPVAYLWTRTVPCPRPGSSHAVPLHRQTWLRKKAEGFAALRPVARKGKDRVEYELLTSHAKEAEQAVSEWDFDPTDLSTGGETTCPFCHAPVSTEHVKAAGRSGAMGVQLMATVCTRKGARGKVYVPAGNSVAVSATDRISHRLESLLSETGLSLPTEPVYSGDSRAFFSHLYGMRTFADHFTARQLLTLLTFVRHVRLAHEEILGQGLDPGLAKAVTTYLALILDKLAERSNSICRWFPQADKIQSPIAEGKMPMMWDFPEANPFSDSSGSWTQSEGDVIGALQGLVAAGMAQCKASRGSALSLPFEDNFFDAVVTDPPYYDNVPYSHLADFFYVWLKRSVGHLYPEHFAAAGSPVKAEAVMEPARFGGDPKKAKAEYERMMSRAFEEAHRVLKSDAPLVCVYAHKTTAGWATLIDALRKAGFVATEAWPIDTENPSRQRSKESAALASSIFLVARRREGRAKGQYDEVRPELEAIVRERVHSLWDAGVTGADLVIACVGAGLRAFTRFDRVEYSNGEEVPAERFLAEVESVVLDTVLARLSKEIGAGDGRAGLGSADRATRFYVLWRYTYRTPVLDAGEAIVFANGTEIELDGPIGLSTGSRRLVEKKQGKYRLLDFTERGEDQSLGLPEDGRPAPLIDALHRTLWLLENHPSEIPEFLREAEPNREQLRLVTQALAGPALKGGKLGSPVPPVELSALAKLRDNWRSIVEDAFVTAEERQDRQTGQGRISYEKGNRR
jgi:putative DNA methylase